MNLSQKGLTLLEILVSVTLFAVMTVFLSQISKLAFRQNKKMNATFEFSRRTSNVLDVVRQDFKGVNVFFDFDRNMRNFFRIKDKYLEGREVGFQIQNHSFFIFNPEFNFIGSDSKIEMATFSLAESDSGEASYQLMNIEYFLDQCTDLKTGKQTQCLIRSVINIENDKKIKDKYILFRGVKSLQFSYQNEDEWEKEWNSYVSDVSVKVILPVFVKMDIEWEGKNRVNKKSYIFSVANSLFRSQERELINTLLAFIRKDHANKGIDIPEESPTSETSEDKTEPNKEEEKDEKKNEDKQPSSLNEKINTQNNKESQL